ncbi:ThuA domain-containing protein [Microbacterium thalassium]|uniref:Type 1 glutamine amidotransferase n=1 Tax=Microbacterium thalassium TaxID=362649 RepID=A0A7X0FNW8_9MICO|nr:ThuA domain-containing protein [Microbacterium thalassium]MBB6390884.1 type 1 glutamine amidotransferase [Microbacterium thalassium]GLK25992.1 hypothetical protein GCM10017607_33110 [Microbacterium thalassium]
MPCAVIAVGTGRYADPWHPFTATGDAVAALLRTDGWDVSIDADVDHALTVLAGADLLVVNAGDPWRSAPGDPAPLRRAEAAATRCLDDAVARGTGILALHAATATLRDYPRFREAIGGEWVEGTSWHPPIGEATVPVDDPSHPVTSGLATVTVFDELYTDVVVDPGAHVLVSHELEGRRHPLVWTREHPTRAVVCALGHDERAYASPDLQRLVRQAARWAGRAGDA